MSIVWGRASIFPLVPIDNNIERLMTAKESHSKWRTSWWWDTRKDVGESLGGEDKREEVEDNDYEVMNEDEK